MAEIFRKFRTQEDPKVQRLRRTEILLHELYRDKLHPPFRVPRIPLLRALGYASLLALVLFSATLFYKFNAFVVLQEDAHSKAGNLEGALQHRANLVVNLVKLTLSHAALELDVFQYTARMRTEIIGHVKDPLAAAGAAPASNVGGERLPTDWSKVLKEITGDRSLDALAGRLLAVVEQYPNIQSSGTYQQAMSALVDVEDVIVQRRMEYHLAVRDYNISITKWPWYMLAEWTNFEPITYFRAGTDPLAAAPEISPDIYQDLMPVKKVGKE